MSEVNNNSLIKSMKDLFLNLSNSSYYDHEFLERENTRFYKQLDLLVDDSNYDRPISFNILKDQDNRTSPYQKESTIDVEITANKKAKIIKETLRFDNYIPGEVSKTQILFESLYKENNLVFKEAYQKCWLDLYRMNDTENFIKFISISSDIDYSLLQERAESLIIAGYAHVDPFVMEAAIRAIEKWQEPKLVAYLNQMRPSEIDWIEQYKSEVIEDLSVIL